MLSLIVHSLKNSQVPFIRLSDFDLAKNEIKLEFVKQIGSEYNGVISADIISQHSGSKKVNKNLGDAYTSFLFGTKSATVIFMYSFSGGPEKGTSAREIKLSTVETSAPSSIISEALSRLRESLFFLQYDNGKYLFTNQPNLNRVHRRKMENIEERNIEDEEKHLLIETLKKEYLIPFIWPQNSKDIPDTKDFKLIILQNKDKSRCRELLENYGKQPRVYLNALIFLCPIDEERINFENSLMEKLAWQLVEKEEIPNLNDQQKKEVKENIKKCEEETKGRLRNFYRIILLPSKDNFQEIDLGIFTYGKGTTIDREVYERLKNEGAIVERIAPLILKERYLKGKDYVETKSILESFYKTPGEIRIVEDVVLKDSIREGVKTGLFGCGEIENGNSKCRHFKEKEFYPEICEGEILISEKICKEQQKEEKLESTEEKILKTDGIAETETSEAEKKKQYTNISLKFKIPSGKLADIARVVTYLKTLFENVDMNVDLSVREGKISISDYEDKIKEALSQSNIEVEEEKLK